MFLEVAEKWALWNHQYGFGWLGVKGVGFTISV